MFYGYPELVHSVKPVDGVASTGVASRFIAFIITVVDPLLVIDE